MSLSRLVVAGVLATVALSACGGGGGGASAPPAPPVANATANANTGVAPLTVTFDASGSTDPQGYPLSYAWTFSDGGTATGVSTTHTFQNHGMYTASVAVNDGHNTTKSNTLSVSVTPAPPSVQPLTFTANVLGVAPSSTSANIVATDRENLALTYSLASQPTVGTATVDPNTGVVSYHLSGYTSSPNDTFSVKVANLGASSTINVSVTLGSDPLLPNQWHVQNVGQDAFASNLPVAGNDLNVTGAWASGYSGKAIKVGVIDSGLEVTHEDLQPNIDLTHSYNFLSNTNDPSPTGTGFDHGTSVAGIIGAVAFNGKGGRGVAFNATLRGYNLLAAGAFSAANMAKAMGSDPVSSDNDIFNASFGATAPGLPQFSNTYQAITATALGLRGGAGAAIVNAAGNDFHDWEAFPGLYCGYAQTYGVSCGDPSNDERRGGYAPIIVGAINAAGVHSSYSSTGSSLWISAPGGEFGLDASIAGQGYSNYDPAIVTTSRDGCANTEYGKAVNRLDSMGANPLAANCQYTAVMNGTSSATPNTAATVAMMLEANPKLSVRDIKFVLAKTAKRVDPSFPGVSSTAILSGATIVLEQGWVTNGAGYAFSNRYGFGGVDASAAVAMAKTYTNLLPPLQNSAGNYSFTASTSAYIVPPASATGAAISYPVSEPFQTVEFVVVFLNIDTTPGLQCNQVELTSPAGTKSILLHAANGFTNSAIANSRIESNAFYGEQINGTWALRFLDFCAATGTPTALSTTQPQVLLFSGH